jgi:hypothetical protein
VKIEKEPNSESSEVQVRLELGFVIFAKRLNGLELHDHSIIDDQICAVSNVDAELIVVQRNRMLFDDLKATFPQLESETSVVGTLEQAGAEASVDFQGGLDDLTRLCVQLLATEMMTVHGEDSVPGVTPTSTESLFSGLPD